MKCLDCVSVCPKEALYFGVAKPKPFATSRQRVRARADFTWPEEIALGAVALVAAQWTFRGAWFGEAVPFLLAVGLGVITAVFALLGFRLLRRPAVTFQHAELKRDGRLTRGGLLALAGVGCWLLFAAHTFAAQRLRHEVAAAVQGLRGGTTPEQLEAALALGDRALAFDLIDDPRVEELRGLVLRGLGRHAEAEAALLRALEAHGWLDYVEANLALAAYAMDPLRERYEQAAELLEHVLRTNPEDPVARQLQEQLQQRRR